MEVVCYLDYLLVCYPDCLSVVDPEYLSVCSSIDPVYCNCSNNWTEPVVG